ncbi:MAG: DUF2809 domain-containing protein [Paraclostridium sp.]|uniref:ribosomal maturation YjgA family protein n=1 Tax=Paraclostridium sp. TaxID=2023273 RepID=UPI003F2ED656
MVVIKKKIIYFISTVVVMTMGILSRKFMFVFPTIIAPFVGDMLWAMMVYFGFRFLLTKLSVLNTIIIAIAFSFSIEISQLYQANWINEIRGTTLGGLVLGHGFLFEDLISYSIGIILGGSIDLIIKLKIHK